MKFFTKSLLVFAGFLLLFGCSTKQLVIPEFNAKQFNADMYSKKVDNFSIIFDASSSMYEKYGKIKKFEIAKTLLDRMNATIPEWGQTAGLRSFGHSERVTLEDTKLFFGMETFFRANLKEGADKIFEPGGFSPLYKALDASQEDFQGLPGRHAVVIISDGAALPGQVVNSAKALKEKYGDAICFYTILVGNDEEGEKQLKEIAEISKCGFYTEAEDILSSAGMAGFVEKVFLTKKTGAPMDSDGDGVYDDKDQCPGTPAGAKVNAQGCWVLENILFDFDKDVIKTVAYPLLDNVAAILKKNPGMNVTLNGHCDSRGTALYNMDLSKRRASAVKTYLVNKGISAKRMATEGYGFNKPVASNATDQGRALNRRVEIQPM